MNTRKYFDKHFDAAIKRSDENGQTIFFCNLALHNFPKWLTQELKAGLSIADVGCAMGECVNIFQKKFKSSNVTGIDFSPVAINGAKIKFPKNNFFCESLTDLKKRYDVIFCSNTLEHFYDPLLKLKKLASFADKYLILLLPFQEYKRTDSHFYTFDYKNIPILVGDFNIVDVKIFNTWNIPGNHWPGTPESPGKQILLIYSKKNNINSKKLNLDSIVSEDNVIQIFTAQLNDLNTQLNKIHRSNFWKIARFYYRIRDFLYSIVFQ